ncbi:16S rRNA (uracil(1498)-N(3))-methyltransferase [Kineobactrum sediminis]|uniref:Ribosomal RNA small subunit methyltransferase E n=1 Tax=Kineobactrum sediminis TaxID=1905677 RepID=A0A2N5Y578_9GAMM|nr:16S rRNA (uracil(1498)-N(3))-methyltransferase [Kineobactrum sediminis]PLW83522.1 16S rRNA (uracil(1498)-N(3))-methyltransferase [Kineobactrum sediminis]
MRIPRIYTPQMLTAGSELALEPGASQHLGKALRMGPGDVLLLFDGSGSQYSARIVAVSKKQVTVQLMEQQPGTMDSPLWVHLGIGISRGERMDWVMQKATELGVGAITPLYTERTEVRLRGERESRKLGHWQQVIISACEQSGRSTLPTLHPPTNLDSWLGGCEEERRFVLHHRATSKPRGADEPGTVCLLVGPEGGLSELEIDAAGHAGFEALTLGPRILRTETAPLAALAILQARWGDMRGLHPGPDH